MAFFTPRPAKGKGPRLTLDISPQDLAVFQAEGEAFVTDRLTGKDYRVSAAPCGLRCRCDATFVPLPHGRPPNGVL